jgi:hypothetical protein
MDTSSPAPPLYKFRAYDTDDHRDWVRRTLLAGEIRFARPPQFNDPFEARPNFVRAEDDIDKWRAAVRKSALRMFKGSATKRFEAAQRAAHLIDRDLGGARQTQLAWLATECAIYSMAGTRKNPLLWAHYAANHTGLCVHIDHTRPPFSIAQPVKYSEDYPTVEFPRRHPPAETLERCLFRKAECWVYESEHRLCRIEFASAIARDLGMTWNDLVATAPIDRFMGITLGVRMPDPHKQELIALAKARPEPLQVWQAGIHETKYEVTFERVL